MMGWTMEIPPIPSSIVDFRRRDKWGSFVLKGIILTGIFETFEMAVPEGYFSGGGEARSGLG